MTPSGGDRSRHVFTRAPDPPVAVRAESSVITDADGRRYLDGAAGAIANSIGHGHRAVAAAMAEQAASVDYVHVTQFTSEPLERYAERGPGPPGADRRRADLPRQRGQRGQRDGPQAGPAC